MQRKHVKILKQTAFLGLSICFVTAGSLVFAGGESNSPTRYEKVFEDPDTPSEKKNTLAKNPKGPLTEKQRNALQRMIKEDKRGVGGYARGALVRLRDKKSVDFFVKLLKQERLNARYYALALGHIGEKRAIPALKEVMKKTEHNYVREDCRFALRLLGASTDETPPAPTDDTTVEMELSASKKQITTGESFVLKASIKNLLEQPVRISPQYGFFEDHLHVYAEGGQYVLRFREGVIRTGALKLDDFPKIPAGKSMTVKQQCTVKVEKVFSDKWPHDGHKAFVFHPGEHPNHLWDVGMHKPGKKLSLQLALVYEAYHQATYADLKAEAPLVKGKIVTNTVTLDVKAPKEEENSNK